MAKNLRVPSYRRHSTGQAVVRIKGRDFYLGPYDSPQSHRAYQEIIGKYLLTGEVPAGPPKSAATDDDSPTMAILADKYLDHARTYYGEKSTEFMNFKLALKPMVKLYGDKYAGGFGPVEFRGCRDWWLTKDVSRRYINSQMKRLKRCLRWCVSFGMFPATRVQEISCIDPLKKGRTTAKERDPVKPVSDAVVEQTLPHMPPVVADMVRLQRLVGCRPGEVVAITPGMVDRTSDVWEIRLANHKTAWRGHERTIYVGPKAQEILRRYLLRGADVPCFSPIEATEQRRKVREANRKTPPSCGNVRGSKCKADPLRAPSQQFTAGTYARAIRYACMKAFPYPSDKMSKSQRTEWRNRHCWAPNRLRHSAGTEIRKAFGIEAASTILGHSGLEVTQVYAEADRQKAIDVIRRIG